MDDFERAELMCANLELNNCNKIKEEIPMWSKEYREIIESEMSIVKRMINIFRNS